MPVNPAIENNSIPPAYTEILLTILIPIYNGEEYCKSLLNQLSDFLVSNKRHVDDIEIVVANNVSTDGTRDIVLRAAKTISNLRLVDHKTHLPTAEENIFRSFDHCNGYYTWVLGVDDIPNILELPSIIEQLRKKKYEFYVYNYATVSEKMELRRTSNFFMRGECYEIDIVSLTARFGFWFIIAGISGQILRTARAKRYDFDALLAETSSVYAHVTAYLEIFGTLPCVIVNRPIVFYKVTYRLIKHWVDAAKKMSVFDEYFWTTGFIKQLKYLENRGVIDKNYISIILDTNEFFFFRPIFVIMTKLLDQVKVMGGGTDRRNSVTRAQFEEIVQYVEDRDHFMREVAWSLRKVFYKVVEKRGVSASEWQKIDDLLATYMNAFIFAPMLCGVIGDYEIYLVGGKYYGVARMKRDLLIEELRYIDSGDTVPYLFVDGDLENLRARLRDAMPELAALTSKWAMPEPNVEVISGLVSSHNEVVRTLTNAQNQLASQLNELTHQLNGSLQDNAATLLENRTVLDQLQQRIKAETERSSAILSSTSWKMTAPIRRFVIMVRGNR